MKLNFSIPLYYSIVAMLNAGTTIGAPAPEILRPENRLHRLAGVETEGAHQWQVLEFSKVFVKSAVNLRDC
jgi:hypothetical protein